MSSERSHRRPVRRHNETVSFKTTMSLVSSHQFLCLCKSLYRMNLEILIFEEQVGNAPLKICYRVLKALHPGSMYTKLTKRDERARGRPVGNQSPPEKACHASPAPFFSPSFHRCQRQFHQHQPRRLYFTVGIISRYIESNCSGRLL